MAATATLRGAPAPAPLATAPPVDDVHGVIPPAGSTRHRVPFHRPGLLILTASILGTGLIGAALGLGGAVPGLAALVAVAVGLLTVYRPDVAALVLVAVTPVVSGLVRGLPIPGLRLSEVITVGLAALIIISADGRRKAPWGAFDTLALLYAGATLALGTYDLLAAGNGFTGGALGTLLGPFQFVLLFRAVRVALPGVEQQRRALRLALLASVPMALWALAQAVHLPGVLDLTTRLVGADIERDANIAGGGLRATGLFPHWQVLGGYLFVVVVLGVALLLEGGERVMRRGTLGAVLTVDAAAMVSTGTFTVVLASVFAALAIAFWLRRTGRLAVALGVAAVAVGLVFGAQIEHRLAQQFDTGTSQRSALVPQSIDYRVNLWRESYLPILDDSLLTGYGPQLPPNLNFPYTESVYLTLLLRGGVPLLLLYLGLMVALLGRAVSGVRSPDPDRRALSRALALVVGLLLPMHLVEPYFVTSGLPQLFWIFAALALGNEVLRPRGAEATGARRVGSHADARATPRAAAAASF